MSESNDRPHKARRKNATSEAPPPSHWRWETVLSYFETIAEKRRKKDPDPSRRMDGMEVLKRIKAVRQAVAAGDAQDAAERGYYLGFMLHKLLTEQDTPHFHGTPVDVTDQQAAMLRLFNDTTSVQIEHFYLNVWGHTGIAGQFDLYDNSKRNKFEKALRVLETRLAKQGIDVEVAVKDGYVNLIMK